MIALHSRDRPADVLRRPSNHVRENGDASAVCPFPKAGIPFHTAPGTHAHRTSIDSQFSIRIESIAPMSGIVNTYLLH